MLKDITLGQYFPMDSPIHSLDPRIKIVLTLFFIIAIFFIQSLWGFLAVTLYVAGAVFLSKLSFKMVNLDQPYFKYSRAARGKCLPIWIGQD